MKKPPSYLDAWLLAYTALMLIATLIAAHGAFVFFSYLLPPAFAVLATVVTAGSIPALDAAGTLERSRRRWLYWFGAGTFLLMETLANYFSAQAVFVANVRQALAQWPSADLVRIAEHPAGRALVVLFLAMPSGIVAYFAYILAERVRTIRKARDTFANRSRRSGQLRALVVKLSRIIRELRAGLASAQADVARLTQEARERLTIHAREVAELREHLAQAQRTTREAQAEAAKLREQPREPIIRTANEPPTRAVLVTYVRERVANGASLAEVSRETGWPESSLRGYLKEATNGVEVLN